MDTDGERGYLADLAAKVKPSGALATLEEPKTVVWIAVAWTWGSAVNTALIAALFFFFDEPTAGWASVALASLYLACWFVFAATGSVRATFGIAIAGSMAGVSFIHVFMGGYANSGSILFWGILVTVVAALILKRNEALAVGIFWVAAAALFGFLEQSLQAGRSAPDPVLPAVMAPYTMILGAVLLVPVFAYLLGRLTSERRRAEALLLNVLPESIAMRLRTDSTVIADDYPDCSVLFADVVGFTPMSAGMAPSKLVGLLDEVFTAFDALVDERGLEKIKTIGDAYMVAAGVPEPRDDHALVLCDLALAVQDLMASREFHGKRIRFRIGINSGPVVAGIIGTKKFSYDLWGDAVNTASRMESSGEPGQIQVSASVRDLGREMFDFESAGMIDMKGIGPTETYLLRGRLQAPSRSLS